MPNSGQQNIESYPVPPGYSVRRATERDSQKLYNSKFLLVLISILTLLLGIFGLWIGIQSGLADWERTQRAILYEFGARSQTPSFQDWQKIILVALGWALLTASPVVGIGLGSYLLSSLLFRLQGRNLDLWIAQYKNQIIGQALLRVEQNYCILLSVWINPSHQGLGVGSLMVWNSVKDAKKPVYLTCLPRLQPFYNRFGFVSVANQDLPPEFQRYRLSSVMALFHIPTLPTERRQSAFPLPSGYSLRRIHNLVKQWQVYQSFWSRERFRQSRIYILKLITVILAVVITGLAIVWRIGVALNVTWLAGIISLNTPLVLLFTIFLWWQEWIVERGNRPMAYAHLYSRPKYSVLYCLHIEPQHQSQDIDRALLESLTRRIQLPVYLLCPRQEVNFYTRLGFIPISQKNLPFELQIIQFRNYVALKLSSEK